MARAVPDIEASHRHARENQPVIDPGTQQDLGRFLAAVIERAQNLSALEDDGPFAPATDGLSWLDEAACGDERLGFDLDDFFPGGGAGVESTPGMLACALCPVRAECAQSALDLGLTGHGIRGGQSAKALRRHGMDALRPTVALSRPQQRVLRDLEARRNAGDDHA